jgi:hypothetical protein
MRHFRRNADDRLRELERAAAAGDPGAQDQLAEHRLRTGELARSAHVLSEGRPEILGALAKPLLRRVFRHALWALEKVAVHTAVVMDDEWFQPTELGTFLTYKNAAAAAADELIEYMDMGAYDEEDYEQASALYEASKHRELLADWNNRMPDRRFFVVRSRLLP